MSLFFPATVRAALAGETIGLCVLARLGFVEGERRVFMGHGRLELGGETWSGLGEFVTLSQIAGGLGDAARPLTFTLSGVDDQIIALAIAGGTTIRGRPATVYLQFFAPGDGRPLDSMFAIFAGRMSRLTASLSAAQRSVSLIVENRLVHRAKPAAGLYSDRDQNIRSPGDRGLEFVNSLLSKAVPWPGR